jgi:iron complex outermembrane receptor protein
MRKSVLLLATAVSLVPLWSVPVQAADGADEGDIIVTARKRQESILNVPVVASVLTTESIANSQVTDIRGVTAKVPGLIIGSSVGSIGAQISLRGVGTSVLDAGIDQSVSYNVDGQQFSQGLAFKSALFDMAQIEVLKGPQALFYGKNSPGGVISVTTADPGKELEIIARTSYEFEAREKRAELILSGPLSDTFGVRLAGTWSDSDGYFYNTATATPGLGGVTPKFKRAYSNENYLIRGTAVWEPSTAFKARLKVNFSRDHSNSPVHLQIVSCPSGTGPSPVARVQFIGGPVRCQADRNIEIVDLDPAIFNGRAADGTIAMKNNGVPFQTINQGFGVLELNYKPSDDINVTSTTTYYRNTTDVLFNGTSGGDAGPALYAQNRFTRRDTTQELRIESDYKDKPLNFMIGGYYQNASMFNSAIVGGNTALRLPAILTSGTHNVGIDSFSLFGQLRWAPIERFEIALGARWTSEKRRDNAFSTGAGAQMIAPVRVALQTPEISSKNLSPELTLTYRATDDLTIFGALKQGFKSGSYSITTPASVLDNSFGEERVRGGEVGLKSRLLNRSLNVNLAGYYYRYKGLQVGVSQPSTGGIPVLRTLNAGSAEVYGVDFDATYRPPSIDNLSLNLSINWNKARFLNLHGIPCYGGQTVALGCTEFPKNGLNTGQNGSGEPVEKAPEWMLNGGFDYSLPLGGNMRLAFGSSMQLSTSYKTILGGGGQRGDYYQRGYSKVNAYVTVKAENEAWEVSLIGNNIGDTLRAGYCANSDFQNTTIFTGFAQTTGGVTNPTGKVDDVGCVLEPGRQLFVRLTLRPASLFRR